MMNFIGQVQSRGRLSSLGDAVKATRAVLEMLAERLTLNEAKDLASQLPSESARDFFDRFGLAKFLKRVSRREPVDLPDATYHTRVVMSVLQNIVTRGEIEHIRAQFPAELSPLFEQRTSVSETKDVAEKASIFIWQCCCRSENQSKVNFA